MFYERFIGLCEKKGVKPSAVAREIGLSNAAPTYWKNGSIPKASTIQAIAGYFGVSVEFLLGTVDENGFLTPEGFADSEDYKFIKLLGLDDPQKRKNLASPPGKPDILDEVDIAFYGSYKELTEDDKETSRQMVEVMRERRQNKKPPQD